MRSKPLLSIVCFHPWDGRLSLLLFIFPWTFVFHENINIILINFFFFLEPSGEGPLSRSCPNLLSITQKRLRFHSWTQSSGYLSDFIASQQLPGWV